MKRKPVVFIADDDPDDRLILRTLWEKINFFCDCTMFDDGQDLMDHLDACCEQASTNKDTLPCLIVVDLNMPRKDGFEVLEELRTHSILNKIPVVVLTTATDPHYAERCEQLGAMACLLKPNNLKDYYAIMEMLGEHCKAIF